MYIDTQEKTPSFKMFQHNPASGISGQFYVSLSISLLCKAN